MTNRERDELISLWRKRANDFLSCAARYKVEENERDIMRYHDIAAVYNICADELSKKSGACK